MWWRPTRWGPPPAHIDPTLSPDAQSIVYAPATYPTAPKIRVESLSSGIPTIIFTDASGDAEINSQQWCVPYPMAIVHQMSTYGATLRFLDSLTGMRRIVITAASMLVLLWIAPEISAGHNSHGIHPNCKPGHRRLLAIDTRAQVYEAINEEGPFHEAYGCAYGHQSYFLGGLPEHRVGPGTGGGLEHLVLTGTTAAYLIDEFGGYVNSARWLIFVRNLRTGQVLHKSPTGKLEEPNPNPESEGIGPALTIVVKTDGAVAWIAEDLFLSEHGPPYYQVHAVDKTGSRVLATGTNINPKSLALTGSTLYWTQGSQAMSATLN